MSSTWPRLAATLAVWAGLVIVVTAVIRMTGAGPEVLYPALFALGAPAAIVLVFGDAIVAYVRRRRGERDRPPSA